MNPNLCNSESITKVAVVQQTRSVDRSANLASTTREVQRAAREGANLVCLQELFSCRYFCQTEDHRHFETAEPIPGKSTDYLADLARENEVVIVAGVFEKRAPGLFHNSAVIIEKDGTLLGVYRKMHIPDDPCYYEKFYFTPGDLGFQSFETSVGKLGVCICWDQWFPEAARLTALRGAEILIYPTAIGWLAADKPDFGDSQRAAWSTMLRSHAIANGVFVVAPNRVGTENQIEFWGSSLVSDPYGNILASAGESDSETLFVDCDRSLIDVARTHWPFLRDRRIDVYHELNQRLIDGQD